MIKVKITKNQLQEDKKSYHKKWGSPGDEVQVKTSKDPKAVRQLKRTVDVWKGNRGDAAAGEIKGDVEISFLNNFDDEEQKALKKQAKCGDSVCLEPKVTTALFKSRPDTPLPPFVNPEPKPKQPKKRKSILKPKTIAKAKELQKQTPKPEEKPKTWQTWFGGEQTDPETYLKGVKQLEENNKTITVKVLKTRKQ